MPTLPAPSLYPSALTFPAGVPPIHVRDKPPLRVTHEITTPSGRRYRWAPDEPDPANVPSGVRHSDTMPGGFEQYSATLPRKPGVDYSDLERLSTVTVRGAGGRVIGEYRLDSAPRSSGDQMSVSPAAVGFQAALDDNKFARMVYVDRDMSRWGDPSRQRQADLLAGSPKYVLDQWSVGVQADPSTGAPAIVHQSSRLVSDASQKGLAESWYDAQGIELGSVFYDLAANGLGDGADANWTTRVLLSDDDVHSNTNVGTDHNGADAIAATTLTASGVAKRFATLQTMYEGTTSGDGSWVAWWSPTVYGDHGLTKRGDNPQGFYASDVVAHAVRTWAPSLGTVIQQSAFVIPHLSFLDATTAGEIVRQASRFDLPDWGVWENRTFWWTERGGQARRWRTRIGPSELEETGPQVDRLWESILVQYTDVDGSTRTVGPPGSGADTESADLKDPDPENPANKLGLVRRDLLQMGVSTAAGAIEVGRRFLLEQRLLDRSGKARAVGYIEDERGVLHPYWAPRAGDEIAFVDASDKSYRRIVRTEKDHDARTISFDLDAPPEGLQALLERLGVVLVPLGVGS